MPVCSLLSLRVFSFVHSANSVGGGRTRVGGVVVDLEDVVLPHVVADCNVRVVAVFIDQLVVPVPSPLDRNGLLVVADHCWRMSG